MRCSAAAAVSRLAFGAMTFTQGNRNIGAIYKVGAQLADELVGRALAAGTNFFDTADGYAGGESETRLGAALKPRRHEAVIATKVGFPSGAPISQSDLSRRHILWSVDQSLGRLCTDWIDVYIAHREDPFTPLDIRAHVDAMVTIAPFALRSGFSAARAERNAAVRLVSMT